jgi:hypothetical protein
MMLDGCIHKIFPFSDPDNFHRYFIPRCVTQASLKGAVFAIICGSLKRGVEIINGNGWGVAFQASYH